LKRIFLQGRAREKLVKALPWETTDQYIHSGHCNPEDFEPNSLRTITLSEEEGIKAIIGKPKGKDTTEVQSYLFDKNKCDLEKAKAWFEKHQKNEAVHEHVSAILPFNVLGLSIVKTIEPAPDALSMEEAVKLF
jgi:hypothetical protein